MKKRICLLLAVLMVVGLCAGCGGGGDTIVIASKQFTENILLSEMYAQLVENRTDIQVERKQNLGGTSVIFPAMQNGEVDMYVEYSGTAYNEILKLASTSEITSEEIYDTSKQMLNDEYQITMFQPIGINNTFALAMLRTEAEALNITTMSDLSAHSSELRFGANHLFYTRETDGYDAMVELYGYNFADALKMDTSLLYEAIAQDELDVIDVYATDSLLRKYDMVILEDDKELFPPYHGTPICRNEVLEEYPELNEVFDLLENKFTDASMQELCYQVDIENKTVEEVATSFLTEQGLLQ